MPATRSRTSTEAPEVAVEDKKAEDAVDEQLPEKEEVKETKVSDDKTEDSLSGADEEENTTDSTGDDKPVDKEETETNGSEATDELKSGTNGSKLNPNPSEEKVENGSAKRKSTGEEAGDGPDSTEVSPKKAKTGDALPDETKAAADNGAGEEEKPTPVETSA